MNQQKHIQTKLISGNIHLAETEFMNELKNYFYHKNNPQQTQKKVFKTPMSHLVSTKAA